MNTYYFILGISHTISEWNEKLNGMLEGKIDNVWAGVAILAVIILVSFWGIGTLNKK